MAEVKDLSAEFRRRRDRRQSLRLRIDRRARELAARDQAGYFKAMIAELYFNRLDENDIERWQPVRGSSPILEQLYAKLGGNRDVAP
jgi:hypothetical protein